MDIPGAIAVGISPKETKLFTPGVQITV